MSDDDTGTHEAAAREPKAAAAPAEAPTRDLGEIVDLWWSDTFPGSMIAQNEFAWNFVHGAVGKLKKRLQEV